MRRGIKPHTSSGIVPSDQRANSRQNDRFPDV